MGGVRTVTGSSHLVTSGRSQVLLDAGLFHGRRDESYAVNTSLSYNPHKINAVVVSHAHIDHCGNIPTVVKNGLKSRIYSTHATKALASLMLEDSGKIQEEDARYLNKIGRRFGGSIRKPLYNRREASKAASKFHPLSYNQRLCIAKNVFLTFFNAGHILGSGIIVLDVKDEAGNLRIGCAVDLGRRGLPLLEDPVIPKNLDYLILETTYGAKSHTPIDQAQGKLKEVINRTIARKGKVIIPSFSLERAQEVIYFLNELLEKKQIPVVPVYVDSPLATDITQVFSKQLAYLNKEARFAISSGRSPFEFLNLRYVRDQKESKSLNNDDRPMIIIAGSGMCESGRVLHHLKNNIEDARNTILVVGYMAKDTLGRRIVDKQEYVKIYGSEYQLNAEVVVINAFSGHADQGELMDFVSACLPLKKVFLVHGEEEQSQGFFQALTQKGISAYLPAKGEEVLLQ
jgi:metallo-beta-lactamase family protein